MIYSTLGPSLNYTKVVSLKKISLHIIVNIVEYKVSLNERLLKNIQIHFQSLIRKSNHTNAIKIQFMSRNSHQNHHYFILILSLKEENLLWIHINKWLSKTLYKTWVLVTTFYLIRIDSVNISTILNPVIRQIIVEAIIKIDPDNRNLLLGRIK